MDAFDAITGDMPPVQPGAIAPETTTTDAEAPYGRKTDGTPKKRAGRKAGTSASAPATTIGGSTVSETASPEYAAGVQIGNSVLTLAAVLGGPDFCPIEDILDTLPADVRKTIPPGFKERPQFVGAYGRWAVARGIKEVPPMLELMLANVGFFGPRFARPQVRSRIGPWLGRMKVVVFGWFQRRKGAADERKKQETR